MFNCAAKCLQCPLYSYYRDFKKNPFQRVSQASNPVTVKTKVIKYERENISAELRIPVLESTQSGSDSYEAALKRLNESIELDITEFNQQMIKAADYYADLAKKNGEKFIPYVVSTIYQVTYNKNDIISITILYYEYIGGRNSYIKTAYNYNLNTGRPISLKDLFISGTDYKSVINREIIEELTQNKDKYFPDAAKTFKGIAEDQPFYIEDDVISVFFGFHQIAPLESKIPVIKIPFSELSPILNPALIK